MLQGIEPNGKRALILAIIAGLIAVWTFGAILVDEAPAQGPGSEFCEEYPDIPGCAAEPVPTSDEPEEAPEPAAPTATAPAPTAEVDTGDELPFTGYPLTGLILLLLLLLLAGLAIRAYVAIRDRVVTDDVARR